MAGSIRREAIEQTVENGRNSRSSRIRTENAGSLKSGKLYLPLSR